jgi:hypothetical protein
VLLDLARASLNDVGGHPSAGDRVELQGGGGDGPGCTYVVWPNGTVADPGGDRTRTMTSAIGPLGDLIYSSRLSIKPGHTGV